MLKEALEQLARQAVAADKYTVQPFDARFSLILKAGTEPTLHRNPVPIKQLTALTIDDLANIIPETGEIWIGTDAIVGLFDAVDRHDRVTIDLGFSAVARQILRLAVDPLFLSPKDAARLFRTTFGGYVPDGLSLALRSIVFGRSSQAAHTNDRDTLGRVVDEAATARHEIPERVPVEIPLYANPTLNVDEVKFHIGIELDHIKQQLELYVDPDEWHWQTNRYLANFVDAFAATAIKAPVYLGTP